MAAKQQKNRKVNKKEQIEVDERKYDKFLELCSICNESHLRVCSCQSELVEQNRKKLVAEVQKSFTKDTPTLTRESSLSYAYRQGLKQAAEHCVSNGIRCPHERFLILDTLKNFDIEASGKYDLTDSNVFLIVRSLLNQLLSAHRMQLYSNFYGVVQQKSDRDGNRFFVLNPVEEAKNRYDNAIVSTVEKLNNVVFGAKSTNMNLNVDLDKKVFSREEMYGLETDTNTD